MKRIFTLVAVLFYTQYLLSQQLVFTSQPKDIIVCEGSDAFFSLTVDTLGFQGSEMDFTWEYYLNGSWSGVTGPGYEEMQNQLKCIAVETNQNDLLFRCSIFVGGSTFLSNDARLIVHQNPELNFSFSGHCYGEATHFTNTTPDFGNFTNWGWSFGDPDCPDSSVFLNPNHMYCQEGSYYVTLIGTDKNGCNGSVTKEVIIYKPIPPIIEGPVFACSYQKNIKLFTPDEFPSYSWSLSGDDISCNYTSDTYLFDVLLDCGFSATPSQFSVVLKITDENNCHASSEHQFLVLNLRSPSAGTIIQKPENSRLLICLLDEYAEGDYVFNWIITAKSNPGDTIGNYTTQTNYKLFDLDIDTASFEYGVIVSNIAEDYCSSTFYLNNITTGFKNAVQITKTNNTIEFAGKDMFFVNIADNDNNIILSEQSEQNSLTLPTSNFPGGDYHIYIFNYNGLLLTEYFTVK